MIAHPPFPDPAPAAVALHRHAVIDQPTIFKAVDSLGRHVICVIPMRGPRRCKVVKANP